MKQLFYFLLFCGVYTIISADISLDVNGDNVFDDDLEVLWNNTGASDYVFNDPSLIVNGEPVYDEVLEELWNSTDSTTTVTTIPSSNVEEVKKLGPSPNKVGEGEFLTATVNDYTDLLLINVDKLLLSSGVDPLALPEIYKKISKKILFIHYSGYVNLSSITVDGLSSIHRSGDSTVTYDIGTKALTFDLVIGLDAITFTTHMKAKLPPFSSTGRVTGEMSSIKMKVSIGMNFEEMKASILNYDIIDTGSISIEFHVGKAIDWLMNLIADAVAGSLKSEIIDKIESTITNLLEEAVDVINKILAETGDVSTNLKTPLLVHKLHLGKSIV